MGRADNQAAFHLPDQSAVKKYESSLDKNHGPSFDRKTYSTQPLLIDITSSPTSAWNLRCSRLFAKQYTAHDEALCTDTKKVMDIFTGQIKSMKKAYTKINRNKLPEEERQKVVRGIMRQRENGRIAEVGFHGITRLIHIS